MKNLKRIMVRDRMMRGRGLMMRGRECRHTKSGSNKGDIYPNQT